MRQMVRHTKPSEKSTMSNICHRWFFTFVWLRPVTIRHHHHLTSTDQMHRRRALPAEPVGKSMSSGEKSENIFSHWEKPSLPLFALLSSSDITDATAASELTSSGAAIVAAPSSGHRCRSATSASCCWKPGKCLEVSWCLRACALRRCNSFLLSGKHIYLTSVCWFMWHHCARGAPAGLQGVCALWYHCCKIITHDGGWKQAPPSLGDFPQI